jgi:hypothetical protein
MTDADYKLMATKVRSLRSDLKYRREREGWPQGHPNLAFLDGRIHGLTDVLMYICPNPMED